MGISDANVCVQGCGRPVSMKGNICSTCSAKFVTRERPSRTPAEIDARLQRDIETADPTTGLPLVSLGQGDYTQNIYAGGPNTPADQHDPVLAGAMDAAFVGTKNGCPNCKFPETDYRMVVGRSVAGSRVLEVDPATDVLLVLAIKIGLDMLSLNPTRTATAIDQSREIGGALCPHGKARLEAMHEALEVWTDDATNA